MFQRTLVIVATVVIVCSTLVLSKKTPRHYELEGYTFERYLNDFKKNYGAVNSDEHQKRKNLFDIEFKKVVTHNLIPSMTWKKGVNEFTDWTEDEKKRLRGHSFGVKSRSKSQPKQHYKMDDRPLPVSFDWRNAVPPVMTAVKSQGACGSY